MLDESRTELTHNEVTKNYTCNIVKIVI